MARLAYFFLLLLPLTLNAGTVVISDTTFADIDWTEFEAWDPSNTFGYSASQQSDGSGGFVRYTTHSWLSQDVALAHQYDVAFNPSLSGAVTGLTYSFLGNYTGPGNPGAVGYQFAVFQSGRVFAGPYSFSASSGYSAFTGTDLAASSFVELGGTDNPDFSASGAQLHFGYITQNGTAYPGSFATSHAVDNWSVTVSFDGAEAPEPATFLLAGCAVVFGFLKRRQKK